MRFEDVLSEVGVFGRFQILSLTILCLPRLILPLHFLLHIFISAVPPHHCYIPDHRNPGNLSQDDLLLINLPRDPDGSFSSCTMFSQPQLHLLQNRSQGAPVNQSSVQKCDRGWDYDRTTFYSTTVTQWDLVCEKKWMNQAAATIFFMGLTTGSLICGFLSDRFGRRNILLVSFLVSAVFGVTSAFAASYIMFSICRLLCGVGLMGMTLISITLALEWTDVSHRTFCGTISSLSWTAGYMVLALLAYFIRDWRWLLLATTSPCLLAIATWWWVPESARWLLTKQDCTAAHRYLSKCAKMNGRPGFIQKISPEVLQMTVSVESRKYNFWDLVRTRQLRKNTACLGVMWFGVAFSYYGISFHVTGFSLSPYLTHFIFGAIEIPAKVGVYLLLDRIGRKKCQGWSLIITATCIGLTCLIPPGHWRSLVAILGKGFSEAAFTTAFLFTAELYPTVLRQTGLGFCSFMTRLGSSVAPLVILLEDFWLFLPSVVFSSMSLLSGSAAFFLTETSNIQLRETIQEVELHRVTGDDISTYRNGRAHQNEDSAHQNEDSVHQNEDSAHQNEDSAHQNEDSSHQNEDSAHQNEDSSHQNEDSAHQNEDSSHQNEDSAHQNEDSAHQNEDSAHQNEETTHQNKDSTQQSKDSTPNQAQETAPPMNNNHLPH